MTNMPSYFAKMKIEMDIELHKNTQAQFYSIMKDGCSA